MPRVYQRIVQRAMHLHGALGVSNEMPFAAMLIEAEAMGIADGPTEVHKTTIARQVLKEHEPVDTLFPSGHLPTRTEKARQRSRGGTGFDRRQHLIVSCIRANRLYLASAVAP